MQPITVLLKYSGMNRMSKVQKICQGKKFKNSFVIYLSYFFWPSNCKHNYSKFIINIRADCSNEPQLFYRAILTHSLYIENYFSLLQFIETGSYAITFEMQGSVVMHITTQQKPWGIIQTSRKRIRSSTGFYILWTLVTFVIGNEMYSRSSLECFKSVVMSWYDFFLNSRTPQPFKQ